RFDGQDVEGGVEQLVRQAMDASRFHGRQQTEARTPDHGPECPPRSFHGEARTNDIPARLFDVRTAGHDVHVGIARHDVLDVEAAGRAGQHVGPDVVAAGHSDVVADVSPAWRVAAGRQA